MAFTPRRGTTVLLALAVTLAMLPASLAQASSGTHPVAKVCLPGKGKTVTQFADVAIPAVTVPDTTTTAATVDGVVIPAVTVPGFALAARVVDGGCLIQWHAPAGCLGAVEITGASIPAITVPARTIPALMLPSGQVVPAVTAAAQTLPAQTAKPYLVQQTCQVTRSAVFRPTVFRPRLFRLPVVQAELVRAQACGTVGCVPEIDVASTVVPSVYLPSEYVASVYIPAGQLVRSDGVTVLKGKSTVSYVAPSDVLFDTGSAAVLPGAATALTAIVKALKISAKTGPITVQGHTDSVGSTSYNLALSLKRAKAGVGWLVVHGHIAKSRLHATGYGESDPVAPNTTAANRRLNRRVVITGAT